MSNSGIWLADRDENGLVARFRILVEHCASVATWDHGPASHVFDDGVTLLCDACADVRRAEEARQARLRRLLPLARKWLESQDINDWRPGR